MKAKDNKILVAYFSRKGDNYSAGNIVNLTTGNTEIAAEMIKELTGGEMFRIETAGAYPQGYTETTRIAQQELRADARPQLAGHVKDMGSYDVVILGYPNWWGTAPMAVRTLLEEYDFTGKNIAPFCTHEGSGMGRSENDIAKLCPGATLLPGLAIRGSEVKNARNEITKWLGKIGVLIK